MQFFVQVMINAKEHLICSPVFRFRTMKQANES